MTSPQQIVEKVEILDGSRAGARDKAAVRIEDIKELLQLAQVKTQTLTAAPTMGDFNSLLKDITEISNRLNSIAISIQKKIIR
ncbi:hypothetical protein RU07_20605 [Agrobacterium tumefaciens]|uniref:Uncharacterized protein n=1 Tax=Agrobacterium tumefaciens TaxID=358 RepID=A0A0D0KM26_AGRTU|nr:hypothetical protein RU07_20605 [Agrobacterium tumefaciens]